MEPQSIGKLIPQVLFPYAQQWAQRSGMPLLSKLLEDEHVHALVEKYGTELAMRMAAAPPHPVNGHGNGNSDGHSNGNGNGHGNGNGNGQAPVSRNSNDTEDDANARHLARLHDRLSALEMQQELQQAMFDDLRRRIRPLALALGCCPECFAGVVGCQKCGGNGRVGLYPPDEMLLQEQIVKPLVALGVQLKLRETKTAVRGRPSESTAK
jgi:hypothetical protein